MPNVTVYIRAGDMEYWRAMPKKSEAIHGMIEAKRRNDYLIKRRQELVAEPSEAAPATNKVIDYPMPDIDPPVTKGYVDRQHARPAAAPSALTAHLPENIRGAFVKANTITPPPKPVEEMPCCKEAAPCRHWVWNINEGDGYINTISGRKKVTE